MAMINTVSDLCNSWGTCDTCKTWAYLLRQYKSDDLCPTCWEAAHVKDHLWGHCHSCCNFTYLYKEYNEHYFCPPCLEFEKAKIVTLPVVIVPPPFWICTEVECHIQRTA